MADRPNDKAAGTTTVEGRALARKVLQTEAAAILALVERLDERFDCAVSLLRSCAGRVIVTGIGKSGLIARKIAATLTSTGTAAIFLHPAEARHGDLWRANRGQVRDYLENHSPSSRRSNRSTQRRSRLALSRLSRSSPPRVDSRTGTAPPRKKQPGSASTKPARARMPTTWLATPPLSNERTQPRRG